MENRTGTNKKMVWAIIALVLLNVATISTVFWRFYFDDHGHFEEKRHHERYGEAPDRMKYIIKDKLQLSDTQFAKFEVFDSIFKVQSRQCFVRMKEIRVAMLNEMTSENPDTAKLMAYSTELGQQHIILKKHLIEMYFSVKSICNKEQQQKLSMIFKNMIANEGMQPSLRDMKRKTDGCRAPKHE
jgi:Spy/CpxP family protein refolding chaperone